MTRKPFVRFALILACSCASGPVDGDALALGSDEKERVRAPDEKRDPRKEAIDDFFEGGASYPVERPVGKPGDPVIDLDTSFPKKDSVFPGLLPTKIPAFKKSLYDKSRVKLATSYQAIFLAPSDVQFGNSFAAAGLFLLEGMWDAINHGEDYQGSLVVSLFDIHTYGDAATPATVSLQTGSIIANDGLYLPTDGLSVGNLYWEQWFIKDRFVVRLGQQQPMNILDFFRYADVRTSFSGPALGFAVKSIPFGPPGLGVSFKWWQAERSGLYVSAAVTDINADINEFDWSAMFETGEVFAGVEIGHNWKRRGAVGGELDHLHLLFFYGDEASRNAFPTDAGWGVKLAGEKQWGAWVGFASYTYNTSRGGGFGFTSYEHAVNLGVAYNKPLGIRGEVALAVTWARELDGGACGAIRCDGGDQFGSELYWKILLAPDFWLTPGVQFAFKPVNNPEEDIIVIPMLKFRLFF